MQTQATNAAPLSSTPYLAEHSRDAERSAPDDVLGQLLYALEQLGQRSLELAETRVDGTRAELRESLQDFLEDVRKAVEKAKKARDDGGFFGGLVDSIASFVGKVVGKYTDAVLPVDSVVTLVEGLSSGKNVMATLQAAALETVKSGETADSVAGFTEGVVKFSADSAAFLAKFQAALARAAVTGEDPYELVADDARALYASFEQNIFENPDFWQVCGAVAKGAAVAGAVATGGTAAIAAVAIFAALELDDRTHFIEKTVGRDAAPYVRATLAIAGAVCSAAALLGGGADAGRLVNIASGGLSGAVMLRAGYERALEAGRQADALDDAAENLEALNRIQQLERLLERLVDALSGDHEDHTHTRELGTDLLQTRVSTDRALIVPA